MSADTITPCLVMRVSSAKSIWMVGIAKWAFCCRLSLYNVSCTVVHHLYAVYLRRYVIHTGTAEFLDAHPQGIVKILNDTVGAERASSMILGKQAITTQTAEGADVSASRDATSSSLPSSVRETQSVTQSSAVVLSAVATGAFAAAAVSAFCLVFFFLFYSWRYVVHIQIDLPFA